VSLVVSCRSVSRTAAGQTRTDSSGPDLDLQSLARPRQVARREVGVRADCTHCYLILGAGERWQQLLVLRRFDSDIKRMHAGHERAIPRTRRAQVMNEVVDERLMTIAELSTMLGVPIDTLYGWRHRGEGPKGYRVGRHVRYRRSSVEAWLDEQADRRRSARE
jgi:excisionase family DNA binding protein